MNADLKNKVYIRTDGSPEIGLGHLVRSIALAQMLKNDFNIIFFCKEIPDKIKDYLTDLQFNLEQINVETNFLHRIEPQDIIVLDGYHFDLNYQKQIKAKGAKLVCIDDLHDKSFVADLIINHAPRVISKDYMAEAYTQFALGPKYALLRPVFLKQAKKNRKIEKVETVMICFGGSDYKNLTASSLKIVAGFSKFKRIIVVTGSSYNYIDSLNLLMNMDKRIAYYSSVDENQLLYIMLESDLAIVPASGILLEVIAVGCIVISGMYAKNQKYVYSNYKNSGSFIDAINFNEVNLTNAIENSLKLNVGNLKIIDGNSGKRLLKLFLQLNLHQKVKLRKATYHDEIITYQWAINPVVRAFSFTDHTISKEEHTVWFHNKLLDSKTLYLIAELDNCIVGSIRFELKGKEALINYLIDPKYHGKGLGQIILIHGLEYIMDLKKNTYNVKKVVGYVMKTNIPSIKVFERLGFTKFEEADRFNYEISIS